MTYKTRHRAGFVIFGQNQWKWVMEKKKISFDLSVYDAVESLPDDELKLMQAAIAARKNAYAPYSDFYVGAAALLENGEVVIGNNQENASFPAGLCAEGVAVFQAGSRFPGVVIKTIAISAASNKYVVDKPTAPCGICRQSISEYENRQKTPISLLMAGEKGSVFKCESVADILPLGFDSSYL
ncbi:cytidine deaminase [Maribacter sp.]